MAYTELVYELLKKDLCAPRVLLEQVLIYINDRYGYPATNLAGFFQEKFPSLEDYEVDLTFSPQYTPAEHNRLEYIPALGEHHLTVSDLALLKNRLNERKLQTAFKSQDNDDEVVVQLHEVFVERYVNLLKLDQKLPEGMYQEIIHTVPQASHNEVNLHARDDVWQQPNKLAILRAFLHTFKVLDNFSTMKVSFLTNFARTYRPAGLLDMDRLLDSLIKSCQVDMENVSGRGFHDEYLKALNVGNPLTKNVERDVWAHYRHMIDMATQLKADLARMPEAVPALLAEAQQQPV
ncbi:hypothetical protein [Vampirovibrio sp.]|uniref:hypothetical protein n=1 Tax=Vampirovibrio sp. TaxID=2717857 RepID=UPI00359476E6